MTDCFGGKPIGGSYDDGDGQAHRVVRFKARRVAQLHYLLAVRQEAQMQNHRPDTCGACQALVEEAGAI